MQLTLVELAQAIEDGKRIQLWTPRAGWGPNGPTSYIFAIYEENPTHVRIAPPLMPDVEGTKALNVLTARCAYLEMKLGHIRTKCMKAQYRDKGNIYLTEIAYECDCALGEGK